MKKIYLLLFAVISLSVFSCDVLAQENGTIQTPDGKEFAITHLEVESGWKTIKFSEGEATFFLSNKEENGIPATEFLNDEKIVVHAFVDITDSDFYNSDSTYPVIVTGKAAKVLNLAHSLKEN